MAHAGGEADRFKAFAEQCMAEYDLDHPAAHSMYSVLRMTRASSSAW
jgi:hypothetical protein